MPKVFEEYFLNFYFLNVDISLTIHDPTLKLYMCTKNIVHKGTLSQIFDRGPSSFAICYVSSNIVVGLSREYH